MYNNNDYDVLKSKIFKRLSGEIVQSDENIISLYDLIQIMKLHYNKYIHLYNLSNETSKINDKSKYYKLLGKKLPKVKNIKIIINNNVPYLNFTFESEDNIERFVTYGLRNASIYVDNYSKDESYDLYEFTKINSKSILKYLYLIEEFILEYGQTNLKLINKNKKFRYDDGFIVSNINFKNLDSVNLILSNPRDLEISTNKRDLVEGELIEYLEFYKEDAEKRSPIELNKLDPYLNNIVKHYYNKNKTIEKKLEK